MGYAGGIGGGRDVAAPGDDGMWRINLKSGESDLILPLARAGCCRRS